MRLPPPGHGPALRLSARRLPTTFMVTGLALALLLLTVTGCREGASNNDTPSPLVVEHQGSIDAGDLRDPNHSDLAYDTYTFEAKKYDRVRVEVVVEDFVPLLKLVEVSTGAPLAEWEERYSDEDALTYMIAGPGMYEARVYAIDKGTGAYTITIRVGR